MGDAEDAFTSGMMAALRSCAGNAPILLAVGSAFGILEKLGIEVASAYFGNNILTALNGHAFYEYAIVNVGLLCLPLLFGVTAAPVGVIEKIAAMEKIMSAANFTNAQRRAFWSDFIKVFIASIGNEKVSASDVAKEMKSRFDDSISN